MATSEGRREVAERMRSPFDVCECDGRALINGTLFGMQVCARDETGLRKGMWHLADLIDPTCTVVSERAHTVGFGCEEAGTEFTLSCGHTVIVDGELPPRYCDECGARVVDEDD